MPTARRVLILDDSRLVLNATREALERAGYDVSTTDTPAEFFTLLTLHQPDLALVDVSMPTLEGDSVVWIARAHQLHTCPIVLFSAKSETELAALVKSSGADGYVCKTADSRVLCEKIASFLQDPHAQGD
jgi:DNA-binding response OmpR family regulator